MFKKLHSNRDPRDTLFGEIKKEFGKYFIKAVVSIRRFTIRYPKMLFGAMIALILLSSILSLTVFRYRKPIIKPTNKGALLVQPPGSAISPVRDGFDQILAIGDEIKETVTLKKIADSLLAKKSLTKQDSLTLDKTLDHLQQIKQHFKP